MLVNLCVKLNSSEAVFQKRNSLFRGRSDEFRDVQVVKTYLGSEISSSNASKLDVSDCRGQYDADYGSDPESRFRAIAKNDIPHTNVSTKKSFSNKNSKR